MEKSKGKSIKIKIEFGKKPPKELLKKIKKNYGKENKSNERNTRNRMREILEGKSKSY